MNHCYRLVFNAVSQVWQAVAETAKSHRKSTSAKTLVLASLLLVGNAFAEPATNALPTGAQVVAGQVTFSQSGNQLNIKQATQKAITNWTSFDIGALSEVNFIQNNASAISLNRILSSDPSQIFGKLNANGQVWLINSNGILFGKSAQVNVGGLLASTLNIVDDDFLSGNYKFTGSTGGVTNMGSIVANNSGYVAMLAPEVRNEGIISALEGTSVLAAGDAITMDFTGNGLINVQVDSANVNALVENKHLIKVGGGQVMMSSKAADGLITSVINNSGRIEADSMVNDGGIVRLTGAKTVINSGEISAKSSATKGGSVHMLGEHVGVFDAGSVSVNGKTGGGTILVGGDFQGKNSDIQNAKKTFVSQNANLSADATDSGDGGKVIVWADDTTRFYGSISAKGGAQSGNGGFVEVSGKNYLDFNGLANTSASFGDAGTLLLDPTNITISTGVNSIESSGATTFQEASTATSILNTTTLQNALALNNVNVTTASAAASAGTITVANAVTWASANSLTLTANSTIAINAAITTGTAASALILNATGNVTQSAAGIIGGAGGVVKNGAGTFTVNRTNTYTGTTTINSGTVTMGANNVFADASTILVNGGTLNANSRTDTVAGVRLDSGAITGTTGALTSTTAHDLRSGTVTKILGGTAGLNKTTAGTVILSGANTYTGATTISAGTLTLGAANRIANASAVTVDAGATFNLNNFAETVGSIAGGGNINLGSAVLTSGGNNSTTIFSGVASGTGGLTKAGTGSLTLSGANTYTGATAVSAGTLVAANNSALGGTGTGTTVASGATLALQDDISIGAEALSINGAGVGANGALRNLNGNNTYGGTITLAGTSKIQSEAGKTLTLSAANAITGTNRALIVDGGGNTIINGSITTGSGTLTKSNSGTLTLSGANTYRGTTAVNAGTLIANNNGALGTAAGATTVATGATLALQGGIATAEALTLTSDGVMGGGALRNLSGNNTVTGVITLGATGARINSDAGLLTLSGGNITGATQSVTVGGTGNTAISKVIATTTGALAKDGAGTLTLSAANTYTGSTNINAGTLIAANANALGTAAGTATVESGATLNVNNVNLAESAIMINGTGVANAGAITGTGMATVSGAVTTASDSNVGTTSAASTLTVGGVFTTANNLSIVGVGDVVATNAASNFSTVNINGAKNVSLRDSNGIILGNGVSSLTGNLSLQTAGAMTQTAGITVAGTTIINAGAANDITLNNAANNFNIVAVTSGQDVNIVDANALTVNASSVRSMTAQTLSDNLTLGGNITATGAGDAIVLASAASFINASNSSLTPGTGRWLVYSADPALDTRGAGLLAAYDFKQYNTAFGDVIAGTGNGFIYTTAPTIAPTLTGTATKVYDGNTTATIGSLALGSTGAIDGDSIVLVGLTSATYDNKNVGTNKTVSADGISLTSANNAGKAVYGYQLASTTATGDVGTITQRGITVTAATDTKTYDATTGSTGAPTITTGSLASGDSATFSQTFDNKNVGTAKTLTAAGVVNDGNSGNNYAVTFVADNTGVINPLAITGSITADNKSYDATTAAAINTRSLTGAIAGDDIAYTGGTASFDNKNAGTGKTVTATGLSLTGTDAGNYTVNTTAVTTADISKADISAVTGIVANNKVYDATSLASLNTAAAAYIGMFGGDNLTVATATGTFVDANAAAGKTVNITGITLGGVDASNYNLLSSTVSTVADINKASLTVTANNASKLQGAANPAFTSHISGFVGGETSAVLTGVLGHNTAAVTSSPAGNYAITPFGLNAANYDIAFLDGVLTVSAPANFAALGIRLNDVLTRPEQAQQTCSSAANTDNVMINGLDAFGADDVEYRESVAQPLVGGVVANALVSPACLKL